MFLGLIEISLRDAGSRFALHVQDCTFDLEREHLRTEAHNEELAQRGVPPREEVHSFASSAT
jgi:hypothetical protein